jgi:prefoldin subunit 5
MFKVDYISKNLENLPGTLNKLTEEISSLNLTEKQKFHIYIISSEINRQIEILKSKISTLHREISKINSKQNQIRDALGDVSLQDNNMTSPNTLFGRVNKLFLTSLTLKFNLPDIIYPDQEQ